MKLHGNTAPLLPLLALGMTLALAAPSHAQYRRDSGSTGTTASLRVRFGTTVHWTSIQGTRVEEIQPGDRPNYDMFRYGGRYYAYDNNRWYMSPQESGDFQLIDDASVPSDFTSIPSDHWRNYPSGWRTRRAPAPQGVSGTLQVNLGNTPQWTSIGGSGVREIRQDQRPGYDVFEYGGSYYAYDNDRWYSSRRDNGDFVAIDDASVPEQFTTIPRTHWRNDPSGWQARRHRGSDGSSASLQINFGSTPRWSGIRGTRVREIRGGNRPDYDMFSYGGSYYVYRDNRWYSSRRRTGQFNLIDDRSVPREFSRIPRSHWRSYPSGWSGR
jgi:frataxin-like iron-binding protein CyaY